ncbi:hypothetical protein ABZ345_22815 [Lentzea sp. NPDC005914]|uniref:hypothetical protein n=1 Tax=Lentzea sp. NPDC005914 TaxID=3154572 RepID=UPI0033DCE3B4
MKTYSYTVTRTRTEAVVDQFAIFLQYAGVSDASRTRTLHAVDQRWLERVAVYLVDSAGLRVLEVAVGIDWTAHSDFAAISPQISTDLPGWEQGAAPEIRALGHRFGAKASALGQTPRLWVRFTRAIRDNADLHRTLCDQSGYQYRGRVPEWRNPPVRRDNMQLPDLPEVDVSIWEA